MGGIIVSIVNVIYASFGIYLENTIGGLLVGFSILMLLFILYRNKLQNSGYFKDKNNKKLPKSVSNIIVISAILLLFLAPFFA